MMMMMMMRVHDSNVDAKTDHYVDETYTPALYGIALCLLQHHRLSCKYWFVCFCFWTVFIFRFFFYFKRNYFVFLSKSNFMSVCPYYYSAYAVALLVYDKPGIILMLCLTIYIIYIKMLLHLLHLLVSVDSIAVDVCVCVCVCVGVMYFVLLGFSLNLLYNSISVSLEFLSENNIKITKLKTLYKQRRRLSRGVVVTSSKQYCL